MKTKRLPRARESLGVMLRLSGEKTITSQGSPHSKLAAGPVKQKNRISKACGWVGTAPV